jgi:hypothetical protein
VQRLLSAAQRRKREVDASWGADGLGVHHVAAYAQSALKFMEACEAMVQLPRTPERLARCVCVCLCASVYSALPSV